VIKDLRSIPFIRHKFIKHSFKKHFHTYYSIGLITQGVHRLDIENEKSITVAGEIKIINPYDLHIADGNISWEYLNFMPTEKVIKSIAQDMCRENISHTIRFQNSIHDNLATKYFLNLFSSIDRNLEYEENFIIFISYLLRNHTYNSINIKQIPRNIQISIDFIHSNFLENISLELLSNLSKLSKYHFIKVFSQKTGLTPHQYIIDLRLDYALSLIKKNIPLSQIAVSCGFSDQSHFIRTFKKYHGYTPSLLI